MNIGKRIRSIFSRPGRQLDKLLPELRDLREGIRPLLHQQDRLTALVAFFNLVSPWQDRDGLSEMITAFKKVNYGQYTNIVNYLTMLQEQIVSGGRSLNGWNRTEPGELVTDDKVYLGDVFGIWTFTVAEFKRRKDDSRTVDGRNGLKLNAYDIVSDYQARRMMHTVGASIIEIIDALDPNVLVRHRAA